MIYQSPLRPFGVRFDSFHYQPATTHPADSSSCRIFAAPPFCLQKNAAEDVAGSFVFWLSAFAFQLYLLVA